MNKLGSFIFAIGLAIACFALGSVLHATMHDSRQLEEIAQLRSELETERSKKCRPVDYQVACLIAANKQAQVEANDCGYLGDGSVWLVVANHSKNTIQVSVR